MLTQTNTADNVAFEIVWRVLLLISALSALWFIILMFTIVSEAPLFMGWAAFNLYTSLVLFIPFQRGERWAWCSTWIQVIVFASAIFFGTPEIAMKYLVAAALMVLGLLLTGPVFFRKEI